eukprot:4458513-Amphidinium_carterae.1
MSTFFGRAPNPNSVNLKRRAAYPHLILHDFPMTLLYHTCAERSCYLLACGQALSTSWHLPESPKIQS